MLPNRLSNEPGTGEDMEEKTGTLMRRISLGDAVSNGEISGTVGSLEATGWTRHLIFSDLALLDQLPKGLRIQGGFMEAWGDRSW